MTHDQPQNFMPVVMKEEEVKFSGSAEGSEKFFRLVYRRVKIGDKEEGHIFWKRGEFVFVVALTRDVKVVTIKEYKQAVGEIILCLPAGAKKESETPEIAALRELREETGYIGEIKNCLVFGPFLNSPDKSTELHHVVLVKDVWHRMQYLQEEEMIQGVELHPLLGLKKKFLIGMNRMAMNIAEENL